MFELRIEKGSKYGHSVDDSGYSTEIIRFEYEWMPPRCSVCKIFGHNLSECPKHVKEAVHKDTNVSIQLDVKNEEFVEARNIKNMGKRGFFVST